MQCLLALAVIGLVLVAGGPQAGAVTFTGIFSGDAESPPNNSPGTGTAVVVLDPEQHLLTVNVTFSGLLSPTVAAHVHCCAPPGINSGIATAVPSFPGFPLGVTSGSYQMTFDTTLAATFNPTFITANGGTPAGAEAALLAGLNDGLAYFTSTA